MVRKSEENSKGRENRRGGGGGSEAGRLFISAGRRKSATEDDLRRRDARGAKGRRRGTEDQHEAEGKEDRACLSVMSKTRETPPRAEGSATAAMSSTANRRRGACIGGVSLIGGRRVRSAGNFPRAINSYGIPGAHPDQATHGGRRSPKGDGSDGH